MITFKNDNMLDYSTLNYFDTGNISFENVLKIHPQDLKLIPLDHISFMCDNASIHDFSNYNGIDIRLLDIIQYQKFINTTSLLDDDVNIDKIKLIGKDVKNPGWDVNIILSSYMHKTNKAQYIMDFTLEMIDCGYEDML